MKYLSARLTAESELPRGALRLENLHDFLARHRAGASSRPRSIPLDTGAGG